MTDSKTREAFEAWLGRAAYTIRSDSGKYESDHVDAMWSAYQAARRAALEEAARYLDNLHAQANNRHNYHQFAANGIRALADETQEG